MLIHHRLLKAAATLTNPDDARFALGTVRVLPTGDVHATDGHIAGRLTDPHREADDQYPSNMPGLIGTPDLSGAVLVPAALIKAVLTAIPKRARIPVLQQVQIRECTPDTPKVVVGEELRAGQPKAPTYQLVAGDVGQPTLHTLQQVAGQFPLIDRVWIPEIDPARATTILSVEVLATLLAFTKAFDAKAICLSVPHEQPDLENQRMEACKPLHARITNNDGQTAELVLMPVGHTGCYQACFPPPPATVEVGAVDHGTATTQAELSDG